MWLDRIEKVNKLSRRKDSEKSAMPGRQEKVTAKPELSTSRPSTTVPIIRQETLSLVLIRIQTMEAIVPRTLTGWSATGLGPGKFRAERVWQKFSGSSWVMSALIMSGNLLQTILHLLQQMIVTLITHLTAVPRLEVPEQVLQIIWSTTPPINRALVHSRANLPQLWNNPVN